ncbi:MAG: hypothetical protein ABIJ15_07095 [bacterium]
MVRIAALLFFLLSIFFQIKTCKQFSFKNTSLFSNAFAEIAHYQDFWPILFGHRRIAADIAFIQLLQYYGEVPDEELSAGLKSQPGERAFPEFSEHRNLVHYALRCTRLDRNFDFAVTFSASALAWVQKREDEAIQVLTDALGFRPEFYQAGLYLSAITMTKNKGEKAAVFYLEKAITFPDCPDLVKSVLARIYEIHGDDRNAVRVWSLLIDSRDAWRKEHAREKIEKYKLIN